MTLLKDNDYKGINVALLSLEADIKKLGNNGGFDTSVIDKQLAEINSRIDKINASGNNSSAEINDIRYEIENINAKLKGNSVRIENIEQKLSDIFSAENKVTDFNATTDSGVYYWVNDAANRPTDNGVLLVNKYDNGAGDNTGLWINQVAYGTNNKIYFRQNINSGNWTEWKAVAFEGQINATYLFYTHGNEINFKGGAPGQCWFNYRNADTEGPSPVATMEYRFCNYSGDTTKSVLMAGSFDGTTAKASSKMVIPIGAPSQLEDGCIWIER